MRELPVPRELEEKMNDIQISWGVKDDDDHSQVKGNDQRHRQEGTRRAVGVLAVGTDGSLQNIAALETQVAALQEEVQLWKGRAEEAAAKAIFYRSELKAARGEK
jgi:hypothetical protein